MPSALDWPNWNGSASSHHRSLGSESRADRHLQFGDIAGRVVLVPLVVELAASPGQPVAAVIDPPDKAFVDRFHFVHRAAMNDRSDFYDRQLDDAHVVALRNGLGADVETGVDDDAAVIAGFLIPGDTQTRTGPRLGDMAGL